MGSKTIVFLGLLATVLLITSEVAARDLVETSKQTTTAAKQTKGVEEAKFPETYGRGSDPMTYGGGPDPTTYGGVPGGRG
ncbi:hypothetical protein RHMOL_Rhmol06G0236000 [Rhododendron molle]|uniref:Uncharacterized protein n=1 Tax=Rhododendron molle TaxID=49168 RepID=A0ACC0NHJ9_RHOML|nr:hypothetical protein RHMOL_Rhmol06G0236000 [Rhododendron molle]